MCQNHVAKLSPLQMNELGKLHPFPHLTGPTVRVRAVPDVGDGSHMTLPIQV